MTTPEDLFRDSFDGFQQEPPKGVWDRIARRLAWRRFLTFSPKTFNVYYLAASLAAGIPGAYLLSGGGDMPHDGAAPIQTASQVAAEGDDDSTPSLSPYTPDDNGNTPMPPARKESHGGNGGLDEGALLVKNHIQKNNRETATPGDERAAADFSCDFWLEGRSGCVPLQVRTHNTSRNTDYCQWYLPDGSISYDSDPSMTINNPGTYIITLKTIHGTHAMMRQDTIWAYPKPQGQIACATQPLMAAVEARYGNANTYIWDFGDGTRAAGSKAAHIYEREGRYRIMMAASNGQCADTAMLEIDVRKPEFQIWFPNAMAFGSGFAPKGDIDNIAQYQLRIYTRNGRQVFETQNPRQAWDGYYNGARLPKGVYVYRTQYEFVNGEKNATSGSIALLWEDK